MKMQSFFHPVWLCPKGNHVRFHGFGVNHIDSCLFLQSPYFPPLKGYQNNYYSLTLHYA